MHNYYYVLTGRHGGLLVILVCRKQNQGIPLSKLPQQQLASTDQTHACALTPTHVWAHTCTISFSSNTDPALRLLAMWEFSFVLGMTSPPFSVGVYWQINSSVVPPCPPLVHLFHLNREINTVILICFSLKVVSEEAFLFNWTVCSELFSKL